MSRFLLPPPAKASAQPCASTVNAADAVPYGVVTTMLPVVAPLGTDVVIVLDESPEIVADTPLKVTLGMFARSEPLMVTGAPISPSSGDTDEMVGGGPELGGDV